MMQRSKQKGVRLALDIMVTPMKLIESNRSIIIMIYYSRGEACCFIVYFPQLKLIVQQ